MNQIKNALKMLCKHPMNDNNYYIIIHWYKKVSNKIEIETQQ